MSENRNTIKTAVIIVLVLTLIGIGVSRYFASRNQADHTNDEG